MQLQNQVTAQGLVTGGFSHNERREELQETKVVTINFQNSRKRDKKDTRNSTLRLTAFSKADWQLALKNRQNKGNRYYKGVQQGITTDLQYFKIYGPGVSLFFYFQKYLIFAYMIMSLVALIPTIFNYVSGSYIAGQGSTLAYYFGGTTIGNFSTSSNYSSSYKLINTITDMLIIFVFIVFYFYWLRQGSTLNSSIKNTIKLRSYYVVELMQFSQNVSIEDVKEFMNRFGAVTEVAPVKNYSQMIALSKTIYDLEVELKELQFKKEQNQEGDLEEQIKQTKMKIDQNYQKLMECQDTQNEEYLKFYISFATFQDRQNTLKKLENHQRTICSCFDHTPDQFLLKGQKVTVRACHTEPTDILWQNQNVNWSTRWIRSLIQLILLLAALCLGFLVVSFMNILVPASASSVSTSSYTSTTILAETNTTIIQSWCIKNYISVLESGSSSSIYSFCWSYIYQYLLKILITLGISVVIVIVKFILKKFIMFLSRFKRYKTQSQQAKDMVLNLFLAYLATTVMITLLLQAYIFGISFKNYIQQIISSDYLLQNSKSLKQYQDFVSEWYLQICYQIFFNCLTMALHPALTMPLVLYVKQKFNQWRAKKEEVQANMQKIIEPSQFQIESNYADLLVIIFMGLAFSGGAPIMTIICFITITFRYLYYKYLFFRHCKIPKTFDEALDNVLVTIIPFGIFLHFAFSIWMFGVTNIFSADTALSIDLGTSTFMQSVSFIFQRILGTYYYSAFFIVFVVFWVFKTLIYNLIIKLAIGEQKGTKTNPNQLGSHEISQDFFQNAISSKSLCASYKIESNPDYVQVLEIMKKKRRLILQVKKVTQRDIL